MLRIIMCYAYGYHITKALIQLFHEVKVKILTVLHHK